VTAPDPSRPDAGQARGHEVPLPEAVGIHYTRDCWPEERYTRAQVEQYGRECAAAAVKSVVAWLNAQDAFTVGVGSRACQSIANRIERGEHL
jgi:hypothetical protein